MPQSLGPTYMDFSSDSAELLANASHPPPSLPGHVYNWPLNQFSKTVKQVYIKLGEHLLMIDYVFRLKNGPYAKFQSTTLPIIIIFQLIVMTDSMTIGELRAMFLIIQNSVAH